MYRSASGSIQMQAHVPAYEGSKAAAAQGECSKWPRDLDRWWGTAAASASKNRCTSA
jgi:hypothetical protein